MRTKHSPLTARRLLLQNAVSESVNKGGHVLEGSHYSVLSSAVLGNPHVTFDLAAPLARTAYASLQV